MPIEYQNDFESFCNEDHYYDRLANLQMADYSFQEQKADFTINGVSIVKGTENNEEWLNVLYPNQTT